MRPKLFTPRTFLLAILALGIFGGLAYWGSRGFPLPFAGVPSTAGKIAFAWEQEGKTELYLVDSTGGSPTRLHHRRYPRGRACLLQRRSAPCLHGGERPRWGSSAQTDRGGPLRARSSRLPRLRQPKSSHSLMASAISTSSIAARSPAPQPMPRTPMRSSLQLRESATMPC